MVSLVSRVVPAEVADALRYYVYVLRDPRDGQVFYVGKGIGGRVFAHVAEAERLGEREKLDRIRAIHGQGLNVEHLIVRSGLESEDAAFVVEQSVIDALTAAGAPLTNLVKGRESGVHGLATVEAAIARWSAPAAPEMTEPTVFFIINRAWRADMREEEIYEATRGHWRIGARNRKDMKYAMGVAFGVVRGVYRIESWFPSQQEGEEGRWGFVGFPAEEMQGFLGTSVRHLVPERGAQNPVRIYRPR